MKEKKIAHRSDCPISMSLDIFGDKWSLLIIRDIMFKGKSTYGEFIASEEKIATNILADRLLLLESGGIISKHKHPDSKAKVLYKLTEKGMDLIPVLIEIIQWSEKHHKVHPLAKEFTAELQKDKQAVIQAVYDGLKSN